MSATIFKGRFYEFHKERIVSRPGAPRTTRLGLEIGPEIHRAEAINRLRRKGDVYTLARQDAKSLAIDGFRDATLPSSNRRIRPVGRRRTVARTSIFRTSTRADCIPTIRAVWVMCFSGSAVRVLLVVSPVK